MFLKDAAAASREAARIRSRRYPASRLLRDLEGLPPSRPLWPRLAERTRPLLLAEIKRASPSRGGFPLYDAGRQARLYQDNGAGAISVVTEERFFQGSLDDLGQARAHSHIPLLRKDFLVEEYQVLETRARGADLVLLLAALLETPALEHLLQTARAVGLECLVEVHTREELERVLPLPVSLVGINHRDLRTLEVRPQTTAELAPLLPPGLPFVAESGIKSAADVERMAGLGAAAVLVGESLLTAPDPARKVRELAGQPRDRVSTGEVTPP